MISYEIRTPTNGVVGIGDLVLDQCPPTEEFLQYRSLFQKSSLRLRQLIDDATLISDLEKLQQKNTETVRLPTLLDQVRSSLEDIQISVEPQAQLESVCIQGDPALLARALATVLQVAAAFSNDQSTVQVTGTVEADHLRLRLNLDALRLSAEAAASFFEIESLARAESAAEPLGLAPVAARGILRAFGGNIHLSKGPGQAGQLEIQLCTTLPTTQGG